MKIQFIKEQICKFDNIDIDKFDMSINLFQKQIKFGIKNYTDTSGLEDYKMNKSDYNILHILYINTNKCKYKLQILLYFIYSYYKLDGICFDRDYFPFKLFFKFLKENQNIHNLILTSIINCK